MKKILFSLCAIISVFSSCSYAEENFLLTQNEPTRVDDGHIHKGSMSHLEKWNMVPVIYDFRIYMVTETWKDSDGCFWLEYSDIDGFDFGDFSDGCPDMSMPIEVDSESWTLFQDGETPISAMYCSSCSLWHIYFEGFTYDD